MQQFDVKVAANGRMVLPASVRASLGLKGDTRVTLVLGDGEATLQPLAKHVGRAQELYRRHANRRSVDDFLADRARDD